MYILTPSAPSPTAVFSNFEILKSPTIKCC